MPSPTNSSHALFLRATDYNLEKYKQNLPNYNDSEKIQYQQLDIEQLRQYVRSADSHFAD